MGVPTSSRDAVDLAVRGTLGRLLGGGMSDKASNQIVDILISDLGEDGVRALMRDPARFQSEIAKMAGVTGGQVAQE